MATRFITVPIEIMHDKKLSPNQKFILSEIMQLSELDKGCFASNKHFAELIGITTMGVSKALHDLEEKGYIKIDNSQTKRNFGRTIAINSGKSPINSGLESKGNIQSKKQDILFSDFKDKFDFINEESFSMLVSHLKAKYGNVTKVRIINNIKKLKDNPSLFIKAVEKMIELDYSGLFVPSSQDKKIKVQENSYVPKYQIHNGKKRADF